jgi:hypothetical protein
VNPEQLSLPAPPKPSSPPPPEPSRLSSPTPPSRRLAPPSPVIESAWGEPTTSSNPLRASWPSPFDLPAPRLTMMPPRVALA